MGKVFSQNMSILAIQIRIMFVRVMKSKMTPYMSTVIGE
jgi:hypothetical protein